jgi:LysM repeat protein
VRKMYSNKTPLWTISLLVGLLVGHTALAVKYKTRPNENLSSVAKLHYGDPKKVIYLMVANGIANPDNIERDRVVWVPTVWQYSLKRGEDLAQVSARYLKDPKRAYFLLWLNRIDNPSDIKPGAMLTMPFLLAHHVLPNQSWGDISRQYYFSIKEIAVIRKFNNKQGDVLTPGETLDLPIFDPEVSTNKVRERLKRSQVEAAAPPAAPAAAATAPPKPAPHTLSDQINDLRDLVEDGEYELATTALTSLLSQKLAANEEVQVRELLAFCLAAQDRYQDAEQEFVHLLLLAPEHTLDPITTSPKIREIFQRARQAELP